MAPPSDPAADPPQRSEQPTRQMPWSPEGGSSAPGQGASAGGGQAYQGGQPYQGGPHHPAGPHQGQPFQGAPPHHQQQPYPHPQQPYPYPRQPYPGQQYGAQQYGGGPQYPGPPPPGPGGRRRRTGLILALVGVVVLLVAGGSVATYLLVRDAPVPAPAPAAAAVPSLTQAPAPTLTPPPTTAAPSGSATPLSVAFPRSAPGSGCLPYTPRDGEYVPPSTGTQAEEVRVCPEESTGSNGVVYMRWAEPADAAAWVTDQAAATTSVDGKTGWNLDGAYQGDYHETRAPDGSCRIVLDYEGTPYAVGFLATSCRKADQLAQDTPLPHGASLPR